jgi:hypothetical protein
LTKHDEIVLALTDDTLKSLLIPHLSKQGEWSKFHFAVQKEVPEWSLEEVNSIFASNYFNLDLTLNQIKQRLVSSKTEIFRLPDNKKIDIVKTLEFPLIKGSGQFKCTKGFIDMIVHCQPISSLSFCNFQSDKPTEFVIEIKIEKDFSDFGSILRQIKEYREYYVYGSQWESKQVSMFVHRNTQFCVLSTKIPDNIKKAFASEGIISLELGPVSSSKDDEQ